MAGELPGDEQCGRWKRGNRKETCPSVSWSKMSDRRVCHFAFLTWILPLASRANRPFRMMTLDV